MRMPTAAEWEHIHALSESLEELPVAEKQKRLDSLSETEDPLVYSCLRAHFLVPEPLAETALAPGTLIAGKYEIRGRIAAGGMGIVYRATQHRTGRDIALKAIRPRLVSPALRSRFELEVAHLAKLRHPALVRLFDADVFTDPNGCEQLFYTMELVGGAGLDVWIRDSGASLERRLVLLEKVCRGVRAAHEQGIVHRDLKPQNILVENGDQPVILDFGLARLRGELIAGGSDDEEAGVAPLVSLLSGTPAYMDPESSAFVEAGETADIYALGVIAFETLTGHLPFDLPENPSLRQVREAVAKGKRRALRDFLPSAPASLDAVVQQAMRRRPVDRYPDAAHFADALLDQATRGQRLRRRTLLAGVLGSLAAISLAAAGLAWNARQESEQRRAQAVRAEQQSDELVDFLLNDLRERLEPTGRLEIMEPVIEKAVDHYERRRLEHRNSSPSLLALANALQTKGGVLGVRGRAPQAEEAFREAVAHTHTVMERDPRTLANVLRVTEARTDLGNHYMRRENFPKALAEYAAAKETVTAALALEPGSREARRWQADSERNLGDALASHPEPERKKEAESAFLASAAHYDALLRETPGEASLREKRALLETSVGSLDEGRGNFEGMLRHFRAYHDHVLATYGAGTIPFAHSAFRMGVASVKTGDFPGSAAYLEPAVKLAEANVASYPNETESLRLLAVCLRFLLQAREGLGETAAADTTRRRLTEVEAELQRILAGHVDHAVDFPSEMARLLRESTDDEEWSRFCYQVRRVIEAEHSVAEGRIAAYREWLDRVGALERAEGGWNAQLALAASSFHNRIGDALETAGRKTDAVAAFDAAYSLRHARWERNPGSLRTQSDLLSSTAHLLESTIAAALESETFAAARVFLDAARAQSPGALAANRHGLAKAIDFTDAAEAARALWPERATEWDALAAETAALILDRLPDGGADSECAAVRERLLARHSR